MARRSRLPGTAGTDPLRRFPRHLSDSAPDAGGAGDPLRRHSVVLENPTIWPVNSTALSPSPTMLSRSRRLKRFLHVGTAICCGPERVTDQRSLGIPGGGQQRWTTAKAEISSVCANGACPWWLRGHPIVGEPPYRTWAEPPVASSGSSAWASPWEKLHPAAWTSRST